jgi:hypothetical protein
VRLSQLNGVVSMTVVRDGESRSLGLLAQDSDRLPVTLGYLDLNTAFPLMALMAGSKRTGEVGPSRPQNGR